jgi:hypothetical protein
MVVMELLLTEFVGQVVAAVPVKLAVLVQIWLLATVVMEQHQL